MSTRKHRRAVMTRMQAKKRRHWLRYYVKFDARIVVAV